MINVATWRGAFWSRLLFGQGMASHSFAIRTINLAREGQHCRCSGRYLPVRQRH